MPQIGQMLTVFFLILWKQTSYRFEVAFQAFRNWVYFYIIMQGYVAQMQGYAAQMPLYAPQMAFGKMKEVKDT